jgi:hypothetical protein
MGDRVRSLREWLHRLWGTLSRRRHDADLEEELRIHLEMAKQDAQRRAQAPMEAGGTLQAMDALRDHEACPCSKTWLATCVMVFVPCGEAPCSPLCPS